MRKALCILLSLIMVIMPASGIFTVAASGENLLADISVADFGSNDQSPPSADFGYEQYTDGVYGKAFHVKYAYYTSFYISLPELKPNTTYQLSFRYNNTKTSTAGTTIEHIHLLNEEQLAKVDDNGKVVDSSIPYLAKGLPLDKGEWTYHSVNFTTGSEDTSYYINFKTGYAFWLQLCSLSLLEGVYHSIAVSGGTADKEQAQSGETVTLTATPAAGQTFTGWSVLAGNVTLADPTALTTTFTMPDGDVSLYAGYRLEGELDTTPMPNLWSGITVDSFGSMDKTPTTGDFGFTAMNDGAYGTKYMITHSYYTTFYVKMPQLKPNTEYYFAFRFDNDIQVVTKGNLELLHILTAEQFAYESEGGVLDSNGKPNSTVTSIAKNIALDRGGWTQYANYFTTGAQQTDYYLCFKTGYAYNMYLCDFIIKETVARPIIVTGGTADKETAKVGETVTLTATPTEKQRFMGWLPEVGDPVLASLEDTLTTFTMPDSAVCVSADYFENLWSDVDVDDFASKDQSQVNGFGFEKYTDSIYGTAFNVKNCYYTGFYIKLPALKSNVTYNLSLRYDNLSTETAGELAAIKLVTEEELATADANGYLNSSTGKTVATKLALDKGEWSKLNFSFTTGEEDTDYYLHFHTNYAYWLRLCDFNLYKNFSFGMDITGGSTETPFALEGERVEITADQAADRDFWYWRVVSGGITVDAPFSETASFVMGNMRAVLEAVCLEADQIKTVYADLNGRELAGSISATHKATLTDGGNGLYTAKIELYTYGGAYAFGGWYSGEQLLSTDSEYTFKDTDVNADTLFARVIVLNVIDGDPGFEGSSNNSSLRVSPPNSEVLPHNDKWGIYNRYSAADRGFVAGYEHLDWAYSVTAFSGTTTDYYKNYTYSPTTATYSLDAQKTAYTITPYSGSSMLGIAAKSRSVVRKLQNLTPETEYTVSFYVNNPTKTDFLNNVVVASTYDMDAGYPDADDERIYGCFKDYDGYADHNTIRKWGKMTMTFVTPKEVTEAYLHLSFSTTNPHSAESKVYIDELTCLPSIISYSGNAIRATTDELPQALRYKFFLNNQTLNELGGMQVNEIGLLAANGTELMGKELLIDGKYGEQGAPPRVGVIGKDNIQTVEGDTTHSYFTAALYNIGKGIVSINYDKYAEDYVVRPYLKLDAGNGKDIVLYSTPVSASVFAVVHEIYSSKNNAADRAVADSITSVARAKQVYAEFEPKDGFFTAKEPVTDYAFSIAVVGDPQKTAYFHSEDMHYTYDWIVKKAKEHKTEYVITLGDITEYSTDAEYELMTGEFDKIEAAGLPQAILRGNHDVTDDFDKYITKSKYGSYLSGAYDGTMKNVYHILTMGGQKYMIMTLDYYDQLTSDIVDWAAGIVAANPDCRVILNTHGLLSTQMQTYTNARVQYLHKNLIMKFENIDLVLCGHDIPFGDDGPLHKTIYGDNGNKIVQMIINPQTLEEEKREAFGLVSTLYFGNDGKTVTVDWYSTVRQSYYMEKFQFTFELD